MRAVVDLEEAAAVAVVADDVVHVRLLGRDREQEPGRELALLLLARARAVPAGRAGARELGREHLLREDAGHGRPYRSASRAITRKDGPPCGSSKNSGLTQPSSASRFS